MGAAWLSVTAITETILPKSTHTAPPSVKALHRPCSSALHTLLTKKISRRSVFSHADLLHTSFFASSSRPRHLALLESRVAIARPPFLRFRLYIDHHQLVLYHTLVSRPFFLRATTAMDIPMIFFFAPLPSVFFFWLKIVSLSRLGLIARFES